MYVLLVFTFCRSLNKNPRSVAAGNRVCRILTRVDSGLLASLPAPHDRATRASRAEGPHTRSASRGPRRRARDARRIAVRLASWTVKNLWSRASARRRRRATPASERDAPRAPPRRRPAVSPRARTCATPRAGSRRGWRAPRAARASAVDPNAGGRRPRARPPIGPSARARRARVTTPEAETWARTRGGSSGTSGSARKEEPSEPTTRSARTTGGRTKSVFAHSQAKRRRRRRPGRGRRRPSRRVSRRACLRARPRTPPGRASSSSGMTSPPRHPRV